MMLVPLTLVLPTTLSEIHSSFIAVVKIKIFANFKKQLFKFWPATLKIACKICYFIIALFSLVLAYLKQTSG